jgi:membrane protein
LTLTATTNALPPVRIRPGRIRRMIAFSRRFYAAWKQDQGARMAATLSFYTFLALTPILVLAVLIAGILFGEAAARGEVVERTRETIGRPGAEVVQGILQSAGRPGEGIVALVIGLLALLIGASRAFQELQTGLCRILTGPQDKKGARKGILKRLISFGLVLSVSLGLVILMIGGMAFDAAGRTLGLPSGLLFARILGYLITFGLGALFLSLLYRFVPDERAEWKDVWIGAGLSAGLLALGRFLVSLYIGRMTTVPSYGAAGLIVVMLIWLYFSARIIYVGAEVARLRMDSKAASNGSF